MPNTSNPAHRIDPWLFIGGPLLALVAGYVNVVLLMSFAVPVSHFTGSLAHLALDSARHDAPHLRMAASVALDFLLGAALTAFCTEGQMFQHRRRYGFVFVIQGLVFWGGSASVGAGELAGRARRRFRLRDAERPCNQLLGPEPAHHPHDRHRHRHRRAAGVARTRPTGFVP